MALKTAQRPAVQSEFRRHLQRQKFALTFPFSLYFAMRSAHAVLKYDKKLAKMVASVKSEPGRDMFDRFAHQAGKELASAHVDFARKVAAYESLSPQRKLVLEFIRERLARVTAILRDSRYNWRGRYKATAILESCIEAWTRVI